VPKCTFVKLFASLWFSYLPLISKYIKLESSMTFLINIFQWVSWIWPSKALFQWFKLEQFSKPPQLPQKYY